MADVHAHIQRQLSSKDKGRRAHERYVVRCFAPHLTNKTLRQQEQRYALVKLLRVLLALVLPTVAVLYLRQWKVSRYPGEIPIYVFAASISLVQLVNVMHRHFILWPEGRRMRGIYWQEIEMAEDAYDLKILGYYHRKIAHFVGHFPPSMTSPDIQHYYHRRAALQIFIFSFAYCIAMSLMLAATPKTSTKVWILYAFSVGSAFIVCRYVKMVAVELPQVLALRLHPQFIVNLDEEAAAEIPLARPVTTYGNVGTDNSMTDERRNASAPVLHP